MQNQLTEKLIMRKTETQEFRKGNNEIVYSVREIENQIIPDKTMESSSSLSFLS